MSINDEIRNYLAEIGRRGGQRSRRKLSPIDAIRMVLFREARRAFRKFRPSCFWSFVEEPKVSNLKHVDFIVKNLKKNGGRDAWLTAAKLEKMIAKCR